MVSDRFSGRVESPRADHLLRGSDEAGNANDSSATPAVARRATAVEVHRVIAALTDLDRRIIEVLSTVRIATGSQMQRLFFEDTTSGQRLGRYHLAKLTDLRAIARLGRQIGGARSGSRGHTYCLDVVGLRLTESAQRRVRRPLTPGNPFIDHTLAVTEVFVRYQLAEQAGDIEVVGFDTEPSCWRKYVGKGGRAMVLKPDAYAEWRDRQWDSAAFIEVDRGTEHPARITSKARQYVAYRQTGIEQDGLGMFPVVVWIVDDQQRAAVLSAALDRTGDAQELFRVVTVDEVDDLIRNNTREEVNE